MYSGFLESYPLKSGILQNPDFLMVRFHKVQFSNGQAIAIAIGIVPTIDI